MIVSLPTPDGPEMITRRAPGAPSATDGGSGRVVAISGALGATEMEQVAAALLEPTSSQGEARRYFVGRAARVEDPRTGVSTSRVKDVLRGELETFIAGWMSQKVEAAR